MTEMAQASQDEQGETRILVWDIPIRIFHWLLVLGFVIAYLTSESERWQLWHVTVGYTFGALLFFRMLWGVVGSRYARFSQFVCGPRQVLAYLRSLLTRSPEHFTGHNPAGALAIVGMLGLGLLTVLTGWASFNDYGDWFGELHEGIVNLLLIIIGVHIAGVLVSSVLHRENLVRAMVNGHKRGVAVEAIRYSQWVVGVLLLAGLMTFLWALLSGQLPWLIP